MKKIFILLFIAFSAWYITSCNKKDTISGPGGRFEIVDSKSSVHGNLVTNLPLTDSNVVILAYKNAANGGVKATVSADTVNGLYIDPTDVTLSGSAVANVKYKGLPVTDGTFVMTIKVTIDGTTYLCSKEFYVDEPNYTAITMTFADSMIYNINGTVSVPFTITPKSTTFSLSVPAHLTADITNVTSSNRSLNLVADAQFISGDVVVTATFTGLPSVVKTLHITAFSGGDGTTAKPFEILDAERMGRILYGLDKAYKLTADITQTAPTTGAAKFAGMLDGNGHKISNCTINTPTTNQTGYFQDILAGGVVKNLTFTNATITGQDYTGVVSAYNHGTITNVTTTGTVKGRTYTGGITGNNFGTITTCDISNMNVVGTNYVASLAGNINSGSSEAGNSIITVPNTFPTELYSVTTAQTIDLAFNPSDGVIAVQSTPANLLATVVTGQQKVTLTPQAGFISGNLQLNLQKNKLTAARTIMVSYAAQGAVFAGGDGSVGNPYLIGTAAALDYVRNEPTKNYKVIADITLTNPWTPIPTFSGSIDGQAYKVTGLTINSTTANDGFFNTFSGTLKNLQMLGVNCTTNSAFGVIAGKNAGGTIQNLTVSGTVTSTNANDVLGGIAGELSAGGKVTQCYAKLNITSSSGMVGGIVGRITVASGPVAEVSYCTTAGSIVINTAKNRIGGIVGRAEGTVVSGGIIKNCLSSMAISSTGTNAGNANGMGGIFGADQNASIVPIDQCMFTGSVVCGFSIGGIAGVGSSVTNCVVSGQTATPVLLSSTGNTPATGSVGGITGTNKTMLSTCVVKNVALRSVTSPNTLPLGGIVSTFQNNGYAKNSIVINTSIEGATAAPNAAYVYRIAGTAGNAPGNSANYVGPNVTAQFRTPTAPFVDDAAGLDGATASSLSQTFLQGIGYDFTNIWKMDTDGYPTLRNAGYNGSLPIPM